MTELGHYFATGNKVAMWGDVFCFFAVWHEEFQFLVLLGGEGTGAGVFFQFACPAPVCMAVLQVSEAQRRAGCISLD